MKNTTRTRIAAAAVASAVGMATVGWALKATPALQRIVAGLKGGGSQAATASGTGASAAAQNAFLVTGSTAANPVLASMKSGSFTGKRMYAYYGYVRVQAIVQNGQLTDVKILEYPNDNGRSHYINSVALPYLIQEAVDAQSYRIDLISGATFSSSAFVKSLQDALKQAGVA